MRKQVVMVASVRKVIRIPLRIEHWLRRVAFSCSNKNVMKKRTFPRAIEIGSVGQIPL